MSTSEWEEAFISEHRLWLFPVFYRYCFPFSVQKNEIQELASLFVCSDMGNSW